MRGPRTTLIGTLVVALLVVAGDRAFAQPGPDDESKAKAVELFEEGTRLYRAGQYDQAIATFRAGFDVAQDPVFVFNIAVTYRKKGDCALAAQHYQEYLDLAPDTPDRADVESRIAEMKACAAKTETSATEDAVGPQPTASDPSPSAGTVSTGVALPPARDRDKGASLAVPLVIGGAGLVATGVGSFLLVSARSKYNELDQACAPNCDPSAWDGYDTRNRAGNILVIGGGALIATGAVVWWLGRRSGSPSDQEADPSVGVVFSSQGQPGVTLTGRF